MHNAELKAKLDQVIEALEAIEAALALLIERHIDEQERAEARQIALELVQRARALPRAADWPWTPNTISQGFLAGRWLRRDGTSYGGAALRVVPGPNSPIAGGQDSQAKVDVPSGAPRS